MRESANGFMVNGGDVEEGGNMGAAVIPNLDSIAEFRILTNNFDAEYGNYMGGLVNVVTKSGTNAFHGDAFEFLRFPNLDARNYFSPTRAALHRNQFGGTIGGPIVHNKIFFFADYQGTRQIAGQDSGAVPVLSAADRSGNLLDVSSQLTGTVGGSSWANMLSQELGYPVSSGEAYYFSGCTSSSQCVFPNAMIPASAISAPSQAMLQYIPQPNLIGGNCPVGTVCYSSSAFNRTVRDDKLGIPTGPTTSGVVVLNSSLEGVPSIATNEFFLGVYPWTEYQINNTAQVMDNFTKVQGTHTFKFGGSFHLSQIDIFDRGANNGTWSFDGSETGSDFADFLLGASNNYLQSSLVPMYTTSRYFSLYGQDSWRAKQTLILNYGLRWEVTTPWYEKHNQIETIVPGLQSNI